MGMDVSFKKHKILVRYLDKYYKNDIENITDSVRL